MALGLSLERLIFGCFSTGKYNPSLNFGFYDSFKNRFHKFEFQN